jgi:hypothetical protein
MATKYFQMAIKYTKWPQNISKWPQNIPNGHKILIPNGHKIYQMATKYTKWPQNTYTKWPKIYTMAVNYIYERTKNIPTFYVPIYIPRPSKM